jgi:hypothetical protein
MKPYALHFRLPPPDEIRGFLQSLSEFRAEEPFSGWLLFGGETAGEIPWDAAVAIGETEPWLYTEVWTEHGEGVFRRLVEQLRTTFGAVSIEELNEDDYA